MKLSIVIPVYNEAEILQVALAEVASVLQGLALNWEVVVVDDGSSDNTWLLLQRLTSSDPWLNGLRGVRFSRNFGKEAAIVAGLRHATGDAVVVMDADLQHPPALIPAMIDLWRSGDYSVVEAVKRRRQRESIVRRLFAAIFYRILIIGAELDLRDSMDFKLLDRRVVDEYLELPEKGRFFRGLTAWIGLPTARIEINVRDRPSGTTRWKTRGLLQFARSSIVSFTALPLHLVSWLGVTGFVFSIALTLQTLWNKWFGISEAGFPTVILLVLLIGSMILIGLGIIGEYLSELYIEIKRRPSFVVRDTLPLGLSAIDRRPRRENAFDALPQDSVENDAGDSL